jgi:hypothetical protein
MMPGILATLEGVAASRGLVWADKLEQLKKNGQWHVEVSRQALPLMQCGLWLLSSVRSRDPRMTSGGAHSAWQVY